MAHTTGPWKVIYPDVPLEDIIINGGNGGSRNIAKVWIDDAPDDEYNREQRANARLIAAAPDMLNTLQDIARYLGNRICRSDGEELMLSRCKESIAKATGGK